jgi:anti-sigma B factor antagonist
VDEWSRALLDVGVSVEDGVALVRGAGELDIFSTGQLASGIREAWEADARRVVIDLTDLSFIDARGVGALVAATVEARRLGRQLTIRDPNGRVRRIARLIHTEDALPLESASG